MFGGWKERRRGALCVVLCAVLASTTRVLCQRCSVFSLASVKDGADTGPQNNYHPTASPKAFRSFLWLGFDSGS